MNFVGSEDEPISFWIDNAKKTLSRYSNDRRQTFVDLGAHIGVISILAVQEYGFQKVVAVEADLENYVHLLDNIAINNCEGYVLPIWGAVSAGPSLEKVALRSIPGSNSGTHSLLLPESYPSQWTMTINIKDIYNMTGPIDFLKVDIEGAEWDMLDLLESKYLDIELHSKFAESTLVEAKEKLLTKYDVIENPDTDGFYGFRMWINWPSGKRP